MKNNLGNVLLYLVLLSVHLKDRDVHLPVNLVTWRVLPHTLGLNATEIRASSTGQLI